APPRRRRSTVYPADHSRRRGPSSVAGPLTLLVRLRTGEPLRQVAVDVGQGPVSLRRFEAERGAGAVDRERAAVARHLDAVDLEHRPRRDHLAWPPGEPRPAHQEQAGRGEGDREHPPPCPRTGLRVAAGGRPPGPATRAAPPTGTSDARCTETAGLTSVTSGSPCPVEVPGIEPGSFAALPGLLRAQLAVSLLGPTDHASESV